MKPRFKRGDIVTIKSYEGKGKVFVVTNISNNHKAWVEPNKPTIFEFGYFCDIPLSEMRTIVEVAENSLRKATKKEINEYMADIL